MEIRLMETEVRVLGSLIEKDITTPEYYPLSMNALVSATSSSRRRKIATARVPARNPLRLKLR